MHRPQRNNEKSKNFAAAMKRLFHELRTFHVLILMALIFASISSVLSVSAPDRLSALTDEITNGLVPDQAMLEEIGEEVSQNFDQEKIQERMMSGELTTQEIQEVTVAIQTNDIDRLTGHELEVLLPTINIDGQKISSQDQIDFLSVVSSLEDTSDSEELFEKLDQLPDSIQNLVNPHMDMDAIYSIVRILAIIYVASALLSYFQTYIMALVSNRFAKELRSKVSEKINRLPLSYFDHNQTGDILSRVTNDIDTIAQSMNQSLGMLISAITLLIGTLIMMFHTNWIMAVTAVLSSLLGFGFVAVVMGRSQKYFSLRQKELGKLNGHIEEIYSGLLIVKAYNAKAKSDQKFDELNYRVYEANRKSQFLSGLMQPMMQFIGNLGYVAVCIVGAYLTMNNIITFGVIVAFMTYVRLFTSPLTQIAQAVTSLQSTAAASERVFDLLDEKEMDREDQIETIVSKDSIEGKVSFDHVKFGYVPGKTIIHDFTADVKPGQKVAIVGPTGAGKTTMVNLLMKFYEIDSGDICIDDYSIHDLKRENIHDLFTMVLQDTWLFEGTVRENIAYNHKDVSDEEIWRVCDQIGLSHFVKSLPKGLDTLITEDNSVSVGQKQLITIARGMIENSPFLILDEATSNVDTRTEELVQKAMDTLMEGKTSFIIAHRLSTIRNADMILVMDQGDIIEQGDHDQLMEKNGFYANLYNSQFQL